MLRSLLIATERLGQGFFLRFAQPQLLLAGVVALPTRYSELFPFLWLAVPKSKVSRMKKRLKTTVQKRIKLRNNIITDPRTGEITLRHRLPFNWKDYLPKDS